MLCSSKETSKELMRLQNVWCTKRGLRGHPVNQILAPKDERAKRNLKFYEELWEKSGAEREIPPLINPRTIPEDETFEELCRGEGVAEHGEDVNKRHCFYKSDHPFLKLAPFKVEIVHSNPRILLFKNVISEEEIESIIDMIGEQLQDATVRNKITGEYIPSKGRTAKSAWLQEKHNEVVATVDKRTELMTGLSRTTAEPLQIASYNLGGHYETHYDFAQNPKDPKNVFGGLPWGNRIATVLYYLSQPHAGGATVFPKLKLSLVPTQNDAVFWHNLCPSGRGDMRTQHAACPVISGRKIVANKWIHEYGQEFRRPCLLKESPCDE